MPEILNLPEIKNLSEARDALPAIVGAVQEGAVYVIRSPRGQALVVGLDAFKELQEAYLDLEGRLESIRMLEDKGMRDALAASFDDEAEEYVPLSQLHSRYLSEDTTEEELKDVLLARMQDLSAAAADSEHLTEDDRRKLLDSMAEAADQLVRAAASAAGVAAARAAEEVPGKAGEEKHDAVATEVAEAAAEETAERFLLSR